MVDTTIPRNRIFAAAIHERLWAHRDEIEGYDTHITPLRVQCEAEVDAIDNTRTSVIMWAYEAFKPRNLLNILFA